MVESNEKPGESHRPTDDEGIVFEGDAGDEATAPPAPEGPAEPGISLSGDEASDHFEIEWFEEHGERDPGHVFAEPAPEPPPQPFELLREPPERRRPAAQRPPQPSRPRPERRAAPVRRRPAPRPTLWKRLVWSLMPLLLLLGGYGSVVLTQGGAIGFSWDEAYYYQPARDAAEWLMSALGGQRPFARERIDSAFGAPDSQPNGTWEAPPLGKFFSGLSILMFPDPADHLYAMRLPMAVLFGLSLMLIYMLGRRAWGTWPGLMAALLFATMPRVFGHAHFASLEMPLIFMTLLVVYCWLRGLESAWWALATGVACGVLFATKINGFFVPIPLVLWSHLYARKRYTNNLFAVLVVGPLAMLAVWPWLWPSPAMRLLRYFAFHLQHQQTAVYFLGKVWGYGSPDAPWYYPLVMIGVTVPTLSLVLIVLGVLKTALKAPVRPHASLFLMIVLVQLGVACAPGTPRYDGVRLFLPVFPFLALLGGSVFVTAVTWVQRTRGERWALWVSRTLPLVILVNGGLALLQAYPYFLSSYNLVAGGERGALDKGFEMTYWGDELNRAVVDRLNALPDGASVMPLAMHERCLTLLQEWGLIKPSLRIGGDPPYDYHLIQMRRGFFGGAEKSLVDGGVFKPIATWGFPGVPLMALYQTGPEFEQYRLRMRQRGVF